MMDYEGIGSGERQSLLDVSKRRRNGILLAILAAVVLLVILGIATLAVVASSKGGSSQPQGGPTTASTSPTVPTTTTPSEPVCHTPGCTDAAAGIIGNINASVNPCEDFYEFACGNWIASHPLEPHDDITGSFEILGKKEANLTAEILSAHDSTALSSIQLTRSFYNTCITSAASEYAGNVKLLELLQKNYGGWPIIGQEWTESSFNLEMQLGLIAGFENVATVITPNVDIDWRQVSRYALYFDQATLALPDAYYLDPQFADALKAYRQSIIDAALRLANDSHEIVSLKNVTADAAAIVSLETELAKLNTPPTERRNYTLQYNAFTIAQLETLPSLNFIDWKTYLNYYLPDAVFGQIWQPNYVTVVMAPEYLERLDHFIQSNATTARAWQNYLLWRVVYARSILLDTSFQEEVLLPLRRILDGVDELPPSSQTCVDQTMSNFPWTLGRLFVNATFPLADQPDVNLFISSLLTSVASLFIGLPWMDTKSKLNAEIKQQGYVKNVAYPAWIFSDTLLQQYYSDLAIAQGADLFDQISTLNNWQVNKLTTKLLAKSTDRTDFQSSPATLNAWYTPQLNSITIPAAILQPPFYRIDYPKSVNYGGIGAVIGHEISHGFDDEGVQYFANGTLYTWMDNSSFGGFKKMEDCVVDEYNHFCYPEAQGLCINGINTQGENLADNAGVRAAWLSYEMFQFSHGKEGRLPGLEQYSSEQVFFLAYAKIWCENRTKANLIKQLRTNVHSPGKYRVNGVLQNFDRFASAWKCSVGQPMAPKDHCVVW